MVFFLNQFYFLKQVSTSPHWVKTYPPFPYLVSNDFVSYLSLEMNISIHYALVIRNVSKRSLTHFMRLRIMPVPFAGRPEGVFWVLPTIIEN